MPVRKKVRIAAAVLMVLSVALLPLAFVIDTSALGWKAGLNLIGYIFLTGISGFAVGVLTLTLTLYHRWPTGKEIPFAVAPTVVFFLLSDMSFVRSLNPLPHDVTEGFLVASFLWPLFALLLIGLRTNSSSL